jgi:hypothetical protein
MTILPLRLRKVARRISAGGQLLCVAIGMLLIFCFTASAQQVAKDYQIKAVFLWRLAQFVTWPAQAFEDDSAPFVIGVLGQDPFGEALDLAVRGETVRGRNVLVQHFPNVAAIKACHILYVSPSETSRARDITSTLAGRSILTVSDIPEFVSRQGGMIRFVSEAGKIQLQINPNVTKRAQLVLDSRLLRMAELTPPD